MLLLQQGKAGGRCTASRFQRCGRLPQPDLAIEVDLSPSRIDRPGIYAAMRVNEVWRFNGKILRMERPGVGRPVCQGSEKRFPSDSRRDVTRWLLDEDSADEIAWLERFSAWLRSEWKR